MSRAIRIGAQIAPQHATHPQLRDAVRRAEDLGVDLIMGWDHFFPLTGDPEGAHFEAFTVLAAMAEQTSRVEFGPLVSAVPFRNPDLVADMARTIDHISARDGVGRFILGLGAGWNERDFAEYGYPFGTVGSRLAALETAVPRIRERLTKLTPPPTRRIPILIGGAGERRTLRVVAEHADIWHAFGDVETLAHKTAVLEQHCRDVGRDPAAIERSTGTSVRGLGAGDPETAERFLELGFTTFVVAISAPEWDDTSLRALLRWRASHL
ncbi:LLM class flavin-dependent oxidoreductase [Protaetiibacter mangrovi]|uniref:LLM class flavin-dependent oxidoreductase n=1 Tax=Protaetiibacter mangrovi TaxID=2970926 RepID=A0ABT1ZI85_9MICO|nr:LLM class flavin-dependent oxidoreductase [Protaetiibacter mangrovi]MCS0500429.1 LLM class flavin-dependent oxidoreductase [Protaetiibacter mangrovi]